MNGIIEKTYKHFPLEWFNNLHQGIMGARVRVDSDETTFEKGLEQAGRLLEKARADQASVWWAGNGGSAAICSHLSQDVLNKLQIRSIYTGDAPLITCMANDFGYEQVYSQPLKLLAQKNDILIAVSSSGNSKNILSCVEFANKSGIHVISLSGMDDKNKLYNSKSNVSFFVKSNLYGIVETCHEAILHGIIETLWLNIQCLESKDI